MRPFYYICVVLLMLSMGAVGCSPTVAPVTEPIVAVEPTVAAPVYWNTEPTTAITAPDGYNVGILLKGLSGPTQMALAEDGALWLGMIAGGEQDSTGQIVRIVPETSEFQVILEGLYKPTGLAIIGNEIWITSGHELMRSRFNDEFVAEPPEMIVELPDAGRSNGTLSVTADGKLLYSNSSLIEARTQMGTGKVWLLDPAAPETPVLVGVGFANPYSHDLDTKGGLWVANMTEDVMNNTIPPDAVFYLPPDRAQSPLTECLFYEDPALVYADSEPPAECGNMRQPVTFFLPHATPTGIVASPWDENSALVALWVAREVVMVTDTGNPDTAITPFLSGFTTPQDLLALPNGALLVSDHSAGTIYQVTKQ